MAGTRITSVINWHDTGHLVMYHPTTFETIWASYPLQFREDFTGTAFLADGTTIWNKVDVNSATEDIVADSSNGQFLLHLAANDEAEDAVLYHGDNKTFDLGNGLIFECRVNMAVEPGTGVTTVFGMCGDHNLDKDTVTEAAWFRLDASMAVNVETDDTTNNATYALQGSDADIYFSSDTRYMLYMSSKNVLSLNMYFILTLLS